MQMPPARVAIGVNDHRRHGWRGRLATVLRRLARRVDGRLNMAVHLETDPPLDRAEMQAAWDIGFRAWRDALVEAVTYKRMDEAEAQALYADDKS